MKIRIENTINGMMKTIPVKLVVIDLLLEINQLGESKKNQVPLVGKEIDELVRNVDYLLNKYGFDFIEKEVSESGSIYRYYKCETLEGLLFAVVKIRISNHPLQDKKDDKGSIVAKGWDLFKRHLIRKIKKIVKSEYPNQNPELIYKKPINAILKKESNTYIKALAKVDKEMYNFSNSDFKEEDTLDLSNEK